MAIAFNKNSHNKYFIFIYLTLFIGSIVACRTLKKEYIPTENIASKPLFRDTIFDGAADPTVIFNRQTKSWFMFYTNRRAKFAGTDIKDVSWVHGTPIGIAESNDNGATWKYINNARFNFGNDSTTYWAPEVIYENNLYHMYVSIVPGIFSDWKHPRHIVHCTSNNLIDWKFESELKLSSEKVIDACIYKIKEKHWRMWYNNEQDHKSIYYADSRDLYHWDNKGKITQTNTKPGEGPNVFFWKKKYYMIVDEWKGLAIYSSTDALNWERQANRILDTPGEGVDDQAIGQHADVVVSGNRAYIFYFTHPGRNNPVNSAFEMARSSIQLAELELVNGVIVCNRNNSVKIFLPNLK